MQQDLVYIQNKIVMLTFLQLYSQLPTLQDCSSKVNTAEDAGKSEDKKQLEVKPAHPVKKANWLTTKDSTPTIPITVNDLPAEVAIDTGAEATLVELLSLALQIGHSRLHQ